MGELPVYTCKAHVFQIDPDTKKKWLPLSSQPVTVSFYHDNTRQLYRIISVDGTKVLVNSTLTANMNFTKTSQKFGQWSDTKASTVYGLGFASEDDLIKFMDKFNEVKSLSVASSATTTTTTAETSPSDKVQQQQQAIHHNKIDSVADVKLTADLHEQLQLVRYENDRLKIALAQSSANAKKWEAELQTLRNNNARLTVALQESATNVEQWKQQLQNYKDDNAQLRLQGVDGQQQAAHVRSLESMNASLQTRLQVLESENMQLKNELKAFQHNTSTNQINEQKLHTLQQELSAKINELYVMNDSLAELLTHSQ